MTDSGNGACIGVLGAGVMGKQLALLFAVHGFSVTLWNRRYHDSLDQDLSRMANVSARLGAMTKEEAAAAIERITPTDSMDALKTCALVVEAVSEDASIKKDVLGRAGAVLPEDALIATNSSTLSITELATCIERPERFLGLHFFNPPASMKLVEVVKGEWTGEPAVEQAITFARQLDKEAQVLPESPGFVVNRILFPMLNEAIFVVGEGVADAATVDSCMKMGLNHPMGPLELADYIGLDVCLSILETLYEETGDPKYRPAPLLKKYVRAGKLGRKSGVGFHPYRKKG